MVSGPEGVVHDKWTLLDKPEHLHRVLVEME